MSAAATRPEVPDGIHLPLLPTGGVTLETAPAFVAAGAIGVGMGGWLLGDGVPAGVRERAASVVAAVAAVREGRLTGVTGVARR